jgi:asparagine synthase (glutamine-hydrolysing)
MTVSAAITRLIIRVGGDYAGVPVVVGGADERASGEQPPDGRTQQERLGPDVTRQRFGGMSLLTIGHCLLAADERAAAFADAVRHGELDRVASWPGAYSAIVLGLGAVTAYADLSEQFPIYYSRRGEETLIGLEPGPLAQAHGRAPDPVTFAANIACPAVLPLWGGRSAYAGVSRVAGGAMLEAAGGRVRVRPLRAPLPVPGRTLGEGAALLRAALADGTRARCGPGTVSADFSGGVDSTSLAFLAAACSDRAVTSIAYHQPLAPAGDLQHALRYAELDPRIRLTVVSGSARTLPYADLVDDEEATAPGRPGGEPHPGQLDERRTLTRLAVAVRAGATDHLTGEGGDAVLMSAPSYLATLVRMGRPMTLLRHSGAYARLRHAAPGTLVVEALRLANTSPERALAGLAAELDPVRARAMSRFRSRAATDGARWADLVAWWPPAGQAASWLRAPARRQLAEIAADPGTASALPAGAGPADLAALADIRRSGDAQRQLRQVARPLGLAVHAPFLDAGVIRAALSVPAPVRADPWSYKPMLGAALSGFLPAEVFARRTKGDYSAEDYVGARAAVASLRALLRESRLAALGVIEPAAVLAAIDRMAAGLAVPLGPLNMLLATEIWLRNIERDGAT